MAHSGIQNRNLQARIRAQFGSPVAAVGVLLIGIRAVLVFVRTG